MSTLSLKDIKLMVPAVMDLYPTLGRYGLNCGDLGDFNLESVEHAVSWIKTSGIEPVGKWCTWQSSYRLKHTYEYYHRKRGREEYLANGDMIVASVICGLRTKAMDFNSPNLFIGVTRKSFVNIVKLKSWEKELYVGIRPF